MRSQFNRRSDNNVLNLLSKFLRGSSSRRRRRAKAPTTGNIETLEARQLLAADLALSSVRFLDGTGAEIAQPRVGEQFNVEVNYQATDLPLMGPPYQISLTIDTAQLDPITIQSNQLTNGMSGVDGLYSVVFMGWYAGEGTHTLSVTLDSGNDVSEPGLGETNNSFLTTFGTQAHTDLPQQFLWPMGGVPYQDWSVVNYVDVDPTTGMGQDFRGGIYQYDGADAMDITLANFRDMDNGIPVYAAADGTVTWGDDGHFDRETAGDGSAPPNFTTIEHGNGWATRYTHLMQDSITVEYGDTVKAGDLLGYIGSSGSSTDAHLDFQVTHDGTIVETMFDPDSFWINPEKYQPDLPTTVLDIGVTDYHPNPNSGDDHPDVKEYPAFQQSFSPAHNDKVYLWYRVSHLNKGDKVEVNWYRPNGTLYGTASNVLQSDVRNTAQTWFLNNNEWAPHYGTWDAVVSVNGVQVASTSFQVGAPNENLRASYDGYQLIDGRSTPIDFGEANPSDGPVTRTITLENKGQDTLNLYSLELPDGFSLAGALPSSVAPQQSVNVTIQMDVKDVGRKFGQVRLLTNDTTYDSQFTFNVSGRVKGTFASDIPQLQLPGPATPFVWGQGSVLIDPEAEASQEGAESFQGIALVAEIASGASVYDWLGIRHQGHGPGEVGIISSNGQGQAEITYDGKTIATTSLGGFSGSRLEVTFNKAATEEGVEAVLRQLEFFNTSSQYLQTNPRYLKVYFASVEIPEKPISDVDVQMVVVTHEYGKHPLPPKETETKSRRLPEDSKSDRQGREWYLAASDTTYQNLFSLIGDDEDDQTMRQARI